ncbi:MAG TPA: hypothetical protein VMT24_17315, partial [Aggregatilineaceae bacterium]|nr:hypothetical protein [Aggregatilineaceae bacterium]
MANPEYQPVSDAEGQRWVDFALFTGLLLLAAIPLVSLGKALWTTSGPLLPVTGLIGLGIALAWLRRNRQPARTADARLPTRRRKFGYGLGSPVLLTLFAVLAFYQPMKRAFWNSTDEAEMLYTVNRRPLSEALTFSDGWEARPLEMFGVALAQTFSPEALDGFVWIAFLFHSATAVFLYGIVHELFHARELALVGTLLYLVNPSEPWRYIAIVMMDYHLSLCLLLASIWLYLHSYRYRLRWMLLAACAALVGVFLTRESALFLAMAVPLLLVVTSKPSFGLAVRKRPELVLWLYAWIGTLALMVLRFVLFWATTPDTYQKHLAAI